MDGVHKRLDFYWQADMYLHASILAVSLISVNESGSNRGHCES
jgi:hypothetical protein